MVFGIATSKRVRCTRRRASGEATAWAAGRRVKIARRGRGLRLATVATVASTRDRRPGASEKEGMEQPIY